MDAEQAQQVEPATEANNSKTSNATENGELFDCEQLLMSEEDDGDNNNLKYKLQISNSKTVLNNINDDVNKIPVAQEPIILGESKINTKDIEENDESDKEFIMPRSSTKKTFQLVDSESDQSDKENSNNTNVVKKPFKLTDSESEPSSNVSHSKKENKTNTIVKKPFKLIDSDSDSPPTISQSSKENQEKSSVVNKPFKLIDTDSEEPNAQPDHESDAKTQKTGSKKIKKLKSKRNRDKYIINRSSIDSDSDESGNDDSRKEMNIKLNNICDKESSISGSQTSHDEGGADNEIKHVKRPPQRVSMPEQTHGQLI